MKTLIYASALAMVLGSGFSFADVTPQQPPAVQQTGEVTPPATGVLAKDKQDLKQDFKARKEAKAKLRKIKSEIRRDKRQLRKARREARREKSKAS